MLDDNREMMNGLMSMNLKGIQNELKMADLGSSEIHKLFKMYKVEIT